VAVVTLARQRSGGGDAAGVTRRRQWQRDGNGDGGAATVEAAVLTPSSDARAFERHQHADVRAFVLGQGRRDDGLTASLSATAAPVARSTVATAAQTKPKATLTIPFFKLNTLLN
jgi:hypothetical protein